MIPVILFDTEYSHLNLLPLSFNRPLADFRVGISTLREKWEAALGVKVHFRPVDYLREKFLTLPDDTSDILYVAGNLLPSEEILGQLKTLAPGEALLQSEIAPDSLDEEQLKRHTIAYRGNREDFEAYRISRYLKAAECRRINYLYDVFLENGSQIVSDYRRIIAGRSSQPLPESCRVIGPMTDSDGMSLIFLEEGASVDAATLNTKDGPIYIGVNAQVMEGASIRGPLCLGPNSKIKMGAKIYGSTTFGPYCKVGGEVDNTVIFGYTNKAHDGYLGNAVIGEWCNIGAGVNASNLKNDYSKIRLWNYATRSFMRTDLQFCGLIMGDHSKVGINAMFNTASVVGVGCNIHGSGFPRVFIPSFSEGSPTGGFADVSLKKFYDIAERVMSRRSLKFDELDRRIYERVYEVASSLKGKKS